MRTAPFSLIALLAVTGGCNTFTTVDEACLEASPGQDKITAVADRELFNRMNCYRRVANRPKTSVDAYVQEAVENHGAYIEAALPNEDTLRNETNESVPEFTGLSLIGRLEDVGFVFQPNTEILEIITVETDNAAGVFTGAEYIDFWFADPFLRPSWLQPVLTGAGVRTGAYTRVFPPETEVPDRPVSFMYWNVVYQVPAIPYAEVPVIYPRNGQLDAPPDYIHLSGNQSLELGRRYGFPITFTVGSRESGLEVTQASLREVGTEVELPFTILTGNEAVTALRLNNTAIMVPEQSFVAGSTYQADIRIKTNQGERRAKTTFTVGGASAAIPAGAARQVYEDHQPLYEARIVRADDRLEE